MGVTGEGGGRGEGPGGGRGVEGGIWAADEAAKGDLPSRLVINESGFDSGLAPGHLQRVHLGVGWGEEDGANQHKSVWLHSSPAMALSFVQRSAHGTGGTAREVVHTCHSGWESESLVWLQCRCESVEAGDGVCVSVCVCVCVSVCVCVCVLVSVCL